MKLTFYLYHYSYRDYFNYQKIEKQIFFYFTKKKKKMKQTINNYLMKNTHHKPNE